MNTTAQTFAVIRVAPQDEDLRQNGPVGSDDSVELRQCDATDRPCLGAGAAEEDAVKRGLVYRGTGRRPPTDPQFKIVYQDDDYIVVDKPADVRMDGDGHGNTVEKFVQQHSVVVKKIHQLDYATSGLVFWARSKAAARWCIRAFEQRTVDKLYLALCAGWLPSDPEVHHLTWPIGADPSDPTGFRMKCFDEDVLSEEGTDARSASTRVMVLNRGWYNGQKISKVLLNPHSGRRHQLRLHLSRIGYPILGDESYAVLHSPQTVDPQLIYQVPRMMLHSWCVQVRLLFDREKKKSFDGNPLPQRKGSTSIFVRSDDPFDAILTHDPTLADQWIQHCCT